MKPNMIAAVLVSALLPLSQAFAAGREHAKQDIQLLNDSASALSTVNPDLSAKLQRYASKEAGEQEANQRPRAEPSERQDIKMLKEAASALKPSRPDLAKGLRKYAREEQREEREQAEHGRPGAPYGY